MIAVIRKLCDIKFDDETGEIFADCAEKFGNWQQEKFGFAEVTTREISKEPKPEIARSDEGFQQDGESASAESEPDRAHNSPV